MSVHESDDVATGFPLKALVEELRSRCEAVARLQGGSTYFIEEIGIFRDYVKQCGHILASPPAALNRPPDDEGNEHQVWFLSDTHRGNLILMDDGLLAPIDLRVQPVTAALHDIVRKLCESAPDL